MSPVRARPEVGEEEILEAFADVMREWGFRPFTHPDSAGPCGGVGLPGPGELAGRLAEFEAWTAYIRTGRIE